MSVATFTVALMEQGSSLSAMAGWLAEPFLKSVLSIPKLTNKTFSPAEIFVNLTS